MSGFCRKSAVSTGHDGFRQKHQRLSDNQRDELNNGPEQQPSRHSVFFFDGHFRGLKYWPRISTSDELVKPERDASDERAVRENGGLEETCD